ncbi:gamma-glutamyltransferase [Limnochorda pilosa]|uniref:Glutathione hydrolase proenzyme n=1 Tax=Limnochorda pilosa TaxID=1555112 RepID=A0A0K2SGY8_LIMPI|nr:gamma-glutamyltransferase [Limnochorda pilosa]BAS26292.1 gamma-glutamyltranspeptidase [Limnochorda pilosa]
MSNSRIGYQRWAISSLVALLVVSMVASGAALAQGTLLPEVRAENGMVASAHPLASEAGVEILMKGGNAIDAAVAAAFALGVVEPNASGLGGEGMMVIHLAGGDLTAIDYRSAAPRAATLERYADGTASTGWESVGVPGTVAGLSTALSRYGTMSLAEVLEPAIRLAEEGFPVSETLAASISDSYEAILADPELASIYLVDGFPPMAGDILRNPNLARTMRILAGKGQDAFYRGEIAKAIAAAMEENGGLITTLDLADYRAFEREPVRGSYRGYEVVSAPPPVGGMAVVEALQILENFDLSGETFPSTRVIHLAAESLKRAFADLNWYNGDPAFVDVPVEGLTSREYAARRAEEIPLDRMGERPQAGDPTPYGAGVPVGAYAAPGHESASTTHLSTADAEGNVVALTQTISSFFGAKAAVPGTGIVLNNEMVNFSTRPGLPNTLAPGKRMRTTIAPTLLLQDGEPVLSIGTPGAGRIVSTMVQLIVNLVDYEMSLQEAIEAPRFYARDSEKNLHMESRVPADIRAELEAMGYTLNVHGDWDLYFGGAQGIMIEPETGEFVGGADPRRSGGVVGY